MKYIYVYGNDYSAIDFEKYFIGRKISEIIDELFDELHDKVGTLLQLDLTNNKFCYILLCETQNIVDESFVKFVKQDLIDYDSSKNKNFYFENEIIKI